MKSFFNWPLVSIFVSVVGLGASFKAEAKTGVIFDRPFSENRFYYSWAERLHGRDFSVSNDKLLATDYMPYTTNVGILVNLAEAECSNSVTASVDIESNDTAVGVVVGCQDRFSGNRCYVFEQRIGQEDRFDIARLENGNDFWTFLKAAPLEHLRPPYRASFKMQKTADGVVLDGYINDRLVISAIDKTAERYEEYGFSGLLHNTGTQIFKNFKIECQ